MRICSLSYCYPSPRRPTWGVFVRQRLVALARRAEVQVASPVPWFPGRPGPGAPAGPETFQGLTVHRPRFFCVPGVLKNLDARWYAAGLAGWLDRLRVDWSPELLDAHFAWPDGVGTARLARRAGLPYAITLRGKIYPCLEIPSQRRQVADALAGAAAVLSVSGAMAEQAIRLGCDEEKIRIIPNGVDTAHFHPRDRAAARAELGLPPGRRWLVQVAHLGPRKGSRELLTALAKLDADVGLVLVGGDGTGGRDRRELTELAERLGVADRLVLAGQTGYDRVPLHFAAADAVVLASYREGCPNVVLEALGSGRPVVATAVGAVPDLLVDGQDGRIVPPRDPDALAEACAEVLGRSWDPARLAAAKAVRTWDDVAEEVYDALRQAAGAPSGKDNPR